MQTTFKQRCIVSSRDALLRRSAEIKHYVAQICSKEHVYLPLSLYFSVVCNVKGCYIGKVIMDVHVGQLLLQYRSTDIIASRKDALLRRSVEIKHSVIKNLFERTTSLSYFLSLSSALLRGGKV